MFIVSPVKCLLKLPPLTPVIGTLWAGGEVVLLATSPSWGSDSWQDPILPLLPQLHWGLEPPGVNRFKPSLHKSNWKNSHLSVSLPSWAFHEAQAPECTQAHHSARAAQELGCWGCTGLTAGEWALVLLLSMTKSLIKQQAARAVNSELECFLPCWCVCFGAACAHHSTPCGVQLPTFCVSHPPTLPFPPPHKAFRVSPKAFYPPVYSKTSTFFFPSSSSLGCCGLELLMKNRLSKPFSSAAYF